MGDSMWVQGESASPGAEHCIVAILLDVQLGKLTNTLKNEVAQLKGWLAPGDSAL
jgi:hypothetical protein